MQANSRTITDFVLIQTFSIESLNIMVQQIWILLQKFVQSYH